MASTRGWTRVLGLVLLAVGALLAVLILTLPASLMLQVFDAPQNLQRPQGTVWSGQARWQQPGQQPLAVSWRWAGGRSWRWQASDQSTQLSGIWQPGSRLMLPELEGRLAVDRLDLGQWLRVSRPQGFIDLSLQQVELAAGRLPRAQGELVWRNAALAGAIQESLGEIRLRPVAVDEALRIEVESLHPAPISVRGEILIAAEDYQVDLWLRSERARPELQQALIELGELQPDGQVRLRLRGARGF